MAFGLAINVGIDLGTSNVMIYVQNKGIVLKEPALVAYDRSEDEIRAFGEEARQLLQKAPGNIVAVRPMLRGVVAHSRIAEEMMKYFLWKAIGRKTLSKPRVHINVPTQATEVERRAIIEVMNQAGAGEVIVADAGLLAALGAGIDIGQERGSMVVDIGGGVTEIAVVSMSGVVIGKTLHIGGDDLDEAIIQYIRKKYNMLIGQAAAERIKRQIGTCQNQLKIVHLNIKGRDLATGLAEVADISSSEIKEAMEDCICRMMDGVRNIIEIMPPELKKNITEQGMVLTGGSALLNGIDVRMEREFNITLMTADNPAFCTAIGAGKYAGFLKEQKQKKEA